MGSFSMMHWLIVAVVVLLLFGGAGKVPRLMGDFAKGIKAFKSGMKEDETAANTQPAVASQASSPISSSIAAEHIQKSS